MREVVTSLESLGETAVLSQIRLHVCFSSRHYPTITTEKGVQLALEGQEGHQQDIVNYLHSELKAECSRLVDQIKDEILESASGIFLWIVLVVQMLNKEGRIYALRKRLDEIPNYVGKRQPEYRGADSLPPVDIVCRRPSKREELYFAVLAEVEPEAVAAWSPEDITKQDMEIFCSKFLEGARRNNKIKRLNCLVYSRIGAGFFLNS